VKKIKCIIKDNSRPKEIRGTEGYIDGYVCDAYGSTNAIVYIPSLKSLYGVSLSHLEIMGYVEV
jgi:hypothetical protein